MKASLQRRVGLSITGLLAVLVLMMLVAGCAEDSALEAGADGAEVAEDPNDETGPAAPDIVNYGVQPSTQPPYIADQLGYFNEIEEEFGTRFEFLTFRAGGPQNNALAAGELDFSLRSAWPPRSSQWRAPAPGCSSSTSSNKPRSLGRRRSTAWKR
ncbi:MAG: hypothetical protein GEU78_15670 [Actinobacteria bacterium]|nr:hypothetical protein [Actinomycetota bacterium]